MNATVAYVAVGIGAIVFLFAFFTILVVVALKLRNRGASAPQAARQVLPVAPPAVTIHSNPAPGEPTLLDLVDGLVTQGERRRRRDRIEQALYGTYGPGEAPKS